MMNLCEPMSQFKIARKSVLKKDSGLLVYLNIVGINRPIKSKTNKRKVYKKKRILIKLVQQSYKQKYKLI